MPSKFGYWNVRGVGHSIRYLLEYVGEDYEEVRYPVHYEMDENGKIISWSTQELLDAKAKMPSQGFHFPSIPHYEDDKVKLTQSRAILRYIGRKYNLNGSTDEEKWRIDVILDQNVDYWQEAHKTFYWNWDEKQSFEQKLASIIIPQYVNYLGKNRYIAGDNLTIADFHTYEMLTHFYTFNNDFKKNAFDNCPTLLEYLKRFEDLPQMKNYMASKRFFARPFYNKISNWGSEC